MLKGVKAERAGTDRTGLFCIPRRVQRTLHWSAEAWTSALLFPHMLQAQILPACCLMEESEDDNTAGGFPVAGVEIKRAKYRINTLFICEDQASLV